MRRITQIFFLSLVGRCGAKWAPKFPPRLFIQKLDEIAVLDIEHQYEGRSISDASLANRRDAGVQPTIELGVGPSSCWTKLNPDCRPFLSQVEPHSLPGKWRPSQYGIRQIPGSYRQATSSVSQNGAYCILLCILVRGLAQHPKRRASSWSQWITQRRRACSKPGEMRQGDIGNALAVRRTLQWHFQRHHPVQWLQRPIDAQPSKGNDSSPKAISQPVQGQWQQSIDAQISKQNQGKVWRVWRSKQRTNLVIAPPTELEEGLQNASPQCFDLAAADGDDDEEQFCPSLASSAATRKITQFFDLAAGEAKEEEDTLSLIYQHVGFGQVLRQWWSLTSGEGWLIGAKDKQAMFSFL